MGRKVTALMHVRNDASAVNRAPVAVLVRRPGAPPVADLSLTSPENEENPMPLPP